MRFSRLIVGLLASVSICMPVQAQETGTGGEGGARGMQGGRQGPQLPPEKAKAAWQTQAQRVAASLNLDKEKTAQLEAAYVAARESNIAAVRAARDEVRSRLRGQDRATAVTEEQRVLQETRQAERAKFESTLKQFLAQEQIDKVMPLLGSFDIQWDFLVDGLSAMRLESDKQTQAMEHVERFVLAMHGARNVNDRETMRQKSMDARRELTESMRALLTSEQMEEFNTAMNLGRAPALGRGGRGGDERPRRPRDGRGGGATGDDNGTTGEKPQSERRRPQGEQPGGHGADDPDGAEDKGPDQIQ